ncbi:putative peroxidase [Helianthus annuus]|nr:putative peroxidase [Helianthus annuus]KAJ0472467.1 putative peroxidase [Helianthus annuus]KAJ0648068.1 putative peroxidase [Helianthus annuus]
MAVRLNSLHLITYLTFTFLISSTHSQQLYTNFYQKSCPRFDQIMQETTTNKQINSPTTAAAALRLFFHDCLVEGCDGSILISSTHFSKAERDADINLSLPGDGFDVVVRAKTALELACPGVVSCSDILAVATRNLVTMMGGPFYTVKLGRRDGLVSRASRVNLPKPSMPMNQLIEIFTSRGFTIQEMVALSGAHTIGLSHCTEIRSDIYNYSRTSPIDPSLNRRYAEGLRSACADYRKNPSLSVFNDVMTPRNFDNAYFQNLPRGLGVLKSDRALVMDPRTRPFVELYARDQKAFFEAFGRAMEKLSLYGVKTGRRGEIRRRCDSHAISIFSEPDWITNRRLVGSYGKMLPWLITSNSVIKKHREKL